MLNISIPFNKVIPFKSSIAEICSISLEHDISINDSELLGDFIITGEYKNLDVNVDTNPFEHVIPFNVSLDDDINIDTLNYEIEDFTYEILNDDSLNVKIILHVEADKKTQNIDVFEKTIDINEDDRLDLIENNVDTNIKENNVENITDNDIDIINNINIKEDYITYHIHYVKPSETIESISSIYNINKDKLLELNDISSIQAGDKIIIPEINE